MGEERRRGHQISRHPSTATALAPPVQAAETPVASASRRPGVHFCRRKKLSTPTSYQLAPYSASARAGQCPPGYSVLASADLFPPAPPSRRSKLPTVAAH